jgi:hypothetical protein
MRSVHPAVSAVSVGVLLCGGLAHADCRKALEGFQKAQRQSRVALYAVADKNDKQLESPWSLRIGKDVYVNGVFNGLEDGFVLDGHSTFPSAGDLMPNSRGEQPRCENAGKDVYQEQPVSKVRVVRGNDSQGITIWFAQDTGLPLFQEDDAGFVCFAYRYADAVKDPVVKK